MANVEILIEHWINKAKNGDPDFDMEIIRDAEGKFERVVTDKDELSDLKKMKGSRTLSFNINF